MTDSALRNAEQLEYWGGAGGERWVAQQARRDELLGDFAVHALGKAAVRPGEQVLDIGCGCGETSAVLAELVGPQGGVLAVDVSAPIMAEARARLSAFANVETVLADAAAFPFPPAAFDLLFSRFGVMFFGDPVAAFANLRKALKPTGRLVFACWRSPAENGWMTEPLKATARLMPPSPMLDLNLPGPFAFHDPDRVSRILTEAGFAVPTFDRIDKQIDVAGGAGLEGAVRSAMELGPTARALDGQDEGLQATIADALRDFFAPLIKDGSVELPAAIWIVSADVAP